MLLTILFVSISIIFLSVYLVVGKVSTKNKNKSKKLNLDTYLWSSIIQTRKKLSNESSSR